ncbi:MAG: endonuclease/exonuclease/phosphatase family protein [Candidatus Nitrotoga sp.]
MTTLNIVTYNIHKGLSHFNQRIVLLELRERLRELNADIVFLQEVQGENSRDARHLHGISTSPQHEFLADQIWPHHAYGKNSVYIGGHHGNALLSRHSIVEWDNLDISAHRFESRGLLHCVIDLPKTNQREISQPLHCICVHFGLFKRGRGMQLNALIERIKQMVPVDARLIVAGDFNDWRNNASRLLAHELQLHEVFEANLGRPARSFPAGIPLLCMDRIYVRGLEIQQCKVHAWRKISDHVALSATLTL